MILTLSIANIHNILELNRDIDLELEVSGLLNVPVFRSTTIEISATSGINNYLDQTGTLLAE